MFTQITVNRQKHYSTFTKRADGFRNTLAEKHWRNSLYFQPSNDLEPDHFKTNEALKKKNSSTKKIDHIYHVLDD